MATAKKSTVKKTVFERLSEINVNEHTDVKGKLSYLSWAWAWSVVKKECPDASYEILPFDYDKKLGYMCNTKVTIEGETNHMWLPVMDSMNKAMKGHEYTYKVKDWNATKAAGKTMYEEKPVAQATMFDINKTNMRCLVKNLAIFGLGLYIYAGEDLPEVEMEEAKAAVEAEKAKAQAAKKPERKVAPKKPSSVTLKVNDENWTERVAPYLDKNKDKDSDDLINTLKIKYKITAATKKAIEAYLLN